jgi:hypothetical protein
LVAALQKYSVKDYYISLVQHLKRGVGLPGQRPAGVRCRRLAIVVPGGPLA